MKYFIKFKKDNVEFTKYIKARTKQEAFIKLLKANKVNSITSMTIEGDPLPTRQFTASELIQKENEAKERKRKGAAKYYELTGKTIFEK